MAGLAQHGARGSRSGMQMILVANIVFFLSLFPYLTPFDTRFDTQPWAFAVAAFVAPALIAARSRLALPGPLWLLLAFGLYAALIYAINSDAYYGLRSLAGYGSVFLFALVAYKTYRHVSSKLYLTAVGAWLLVGLVQVFIHSSFASGVVSRMSTGGPRGVTSLAVEPSFYAIVCIFMLILNEFFFIERKYTFRIYLAVVLALTFQIAISYSALGILFLLVFGVAKLGSVMLPGHKRQMGVVLVIVAIMGITLTAFLRVDVLKQTRAGQIMAKITSCPADLLYQDESVAIRGAHALLPLYSLSLNYGAGLGLGTWNEHAHKLGMMTEAEWVLNLVEANQLSVGGRVLSGWGTAIYELGLIGLLFVATALYILASGIRRNRRMKMTCMLSMAVVFPLMAMAVPLAFPMFGYLLGIHLYFGYADPTRKAVPRRAPPEIPHQSPTRLVSKTGGT